MDDGHAKVKMDEVEKHLDETWFAWIGGSEDDAVYYYLIHSPVIIIEFDHQRPLSTKKCMEVKSIDNICMKLCEHKTAMIMAKICSVNITRSIHININQLYEFYR